MAKKKNELDSLTAAITKYSAIRREVNDLFASIQDNPLATAAKATPGGRYAAEFSKWLETPEAIDLRMEIMRKEAAREVIRRMIKSFQRLENELIIQLSNLQLKLKHQALVLSNDDPPSGEIKGWIPE